MQDTDRIENLAWIVALELQELPKERLKRPADEATEKRKNDAAAAIEATAVAVAAATSLADAAAALSESPVTPEPTKPTESFPSDLEDESKADSTIEHFILWKELSKDKLRAVTMAYMQDYTHTPTIMPDSREFARAAKVIEDELLKYHIDVEEKPFDTFYETIKGVSLEALEEKFETLNTKPSASTSISAAAPAGSTASPSSRSNNDTNAAAASRSPPVHRLMCPVLAQAGPVDIIDLTVDDLHDFELTVGAKKTKMVATLAGGEMAEKGPQIHRRGKGGCIKFDKADKDWASTKTWEFIQIQGLVNLLTTLYGVLPAPGSKDDKDKRALNCAVKLGFFQEDVCTSRAHAVAHCGGWLPPLLQSAFIPYMGTLEGIIGPFCNCDRDVRKKYKLAKSAIENGNFPEAETTALCRIIKAVVKTDADKLKAKKAAAAAKKVAAATATP